MKKVFAFAAAAVAVGFASCSDEKEASVASVNYEECTFVLSTETAEISQDLTRAVSEEEPRMVSCYFPNAKGNKKFLVEEGNQLTVLLPAGMQSTGYFVQADEKNDFTADSDFCIDITKSNEHVYSAKWIGTPENSQGTDITLTRRVGKFTAVQGTINDGYSIIVEVVGDQFYNWVDDSPNGQRVTIFNNASIINPLDCYVLGGEGSKVAVTAKVIRNEATATQPAGATVHTKIYTYQLRNNQHLTVTYNAELFFDVEAGVKVERDVEFDTTSEEVTIKNK